MAKNSGINPGDRIRLALGKRTIEGTLMPRIESGNKNAIILKLDSGYNAGFDARNVKSILKIAGAQEIPRVPALTAKYDDSKPRTAMIATGGTISTRVDYRTGGVFMTLKPEEILQNAPQIANIINLTQVSSPFTIASEDMSITDIQEIAKEAAKLLNAGNHGLIITHGTDILHYTASAIALMLNNPARPIALVGAQRSPDRASFDGSMNLLCAAHYAASGIGEIAVVMHANTNDEYCHANPATKVRKMHTSRRDAFRTINGPPIARIYPDGRIDELRENRRANDEKIVADTRFEDKTALVKLVPGLDPEILQYYADKKYRGLILEGFGLGHVPNETREPGYNWVKAVRRAIDAGVFIGITSQCINGRVNSNVYRNLRDLAAAGATHLEDMLPETAYIKLGCALGRLKDAGKARKFMLENVAGEFNPRLTE